MIEHLLYRYMANTAAMETAGIEEVTKVATEAISNIRTVASLRKYIMQYIYYVFTNLVPHFQDKSHTSSPVIVLKLPDWKKPY